MEGWVKSTVLTQLVRCTCILGGVLVAVKYNENLDKSVERCSRMSRVMVSEGAQHCSVEYTRVES